MGYDSSIPIIQFTKRLEIENYATNAAGSDRTFTYTTYFFTNAPANGDKHFWKFFCSGLETKLDIHYYRASDTGIVDLYLNGILDTSGIDLYNAAGAFVTIQVTLTTIPAPGSNLVELRVNGKNGASTNYYVDTFGLRLK